MRGGEDAARKIGRGVWFEPSDVVEHVEAARLERITALVDRVIGAGNPDRAVGLQQAARFFNPGAMKIHIVGDAARFVPAALVNWHALAAVNGKASIGEKVWRIGEHHVERLGRHGAHHVEGVSLE